MITIRRGDLFASSAQTLVNPVNCQGGLGAGRARLFRERFPEMARDDRRRCRRGEVVLGRPSLYRQEPPPWIRYVPTKRSWADHSPLAAIADGLLFLGDQCDEWGITSLAVPAVGCGHGGLSWDDVRPILVGILSGLEIPVEIYEPWEG